MSYEAVPKFTSVLKTNLNKLSFTADIKTCWKLTEKKKSALLYYGELDFSLTDIYLPI